MYDSFKPGEVITECVYKVTTPNGSEHLYAMTLEKSGAFSYGNETCVGVHLVNGGNPDFGIDTRYENGCNTPDKFKSWSLSWLRDYCRPDCKIERM